VAVSRDREMRADILRIAAMEATIRVMASVGPVGEVDIADRFGLSMIEACRLLNGMVADGNIRPRARKRPDWLEQQNAKSESLKQTSRWQERFAEPYWDYYESLSLAMYQMPEKLHTITPDNYRREKWYGDEHFEQRRKEFLREWQLGTIKAFVRGTEVPPAAAVDPSRLIEDPDLIFDAKTIKAKFLTSGVPTAVADSVADPRMNKAKKKSKTSEKLDQKYKAIIETIEDGVRPIGPHRNIPNTKEWLYRVQLKMRPDLFQRERSNSVRLLESISVKKINWPTRALKDIGLDRRTVDRALKKLAEENDHVKELLETPGILPDLGDHPYPHP
jgi:uncharacterized protein YjiS (DUF1127 family)